MTAMHCHAAELCPPEASSQASATPESTATIVAVPRGWVRPAHAMTRMKKIGYTAIADSLRE